MTDLDLDKASPEEVLAVLQRAADRFWESEGALAAAWQDKGAGRPWRIIAIELERALMQMKRRLP